MENKNGRTLEEETSKDFVIIFAPLISKLTNVNVFFKINQDANKFVFQSTNKVHFKIVEPPRLSGYELEKINNYFNPSQFKKDLSVGIDASLKKLKARLIRVTPTKKNNFIKAIIADVEQYSVRMLHTGIDLSQFKDPDPQQPTVSFSLGDYGFNIRYLDHNIAEQILKFAFVLRELLLDTLDVIKKMQTDNSQTIMNTQNDKTSEKKYKLKTKLNVNQLAYLFQILNAKGILETRTNTELYRFIAANFATRNKDSVEESVVKNNSLDPTLKTIEYWESKFRSFTMLCGKEINELKNKNK